MFLSQVLWSSFGHYCNVSTSFQHLHSKRWTSSQARCYTVSASHTTALMEASQHAVTSEKNKVWPCKAVLCFFITFTSMLFSQNHTSSYCLLVILCEKAFAKLSQIQTRLSSWLRRQTKSQRSMKATYYSMADGKLTQNQSWNNQAVNVIHLNKNQEIIHVSLPCFPCVFCFSFGQLSSSRNYRFRFLKHKSVNQNPSISHNINSTSQQLVLDPNTRK